MIEDRVMKCLEVSDHPEIDEISAWPLCPFCDDPLWEGEVLVMVKWAAGGDASGGGRVCGLAHAFCADYERSEADDG